MAGTFYKHDIYCVLGIDPGKTGAVSIFERASNGYYLDCIVDFDEYKVRQKIWDINNLEHVVAFIENVHAAPGQSVSAMFNFGQNFGWWKGMLDASNIPYIAIAPQSWSPKMLGRTDDKKNKAREVATQLFSRGLDTKVDPNGHSWFHLKKHDGRADSALIGWYWIQKYLK